MALATDPDLARIRGGPFLMGAADAGEDERPVHRVHPDCYARSGTCASRGPETGTMRIGRAGSWVNDAPAMLRSVCRHKVPRDTRVDSIGFRIACQP